MIVDTVEVFACRQFVIADVEFLLSSSAKSEPHICGREQLRMIETVPQTSRSVTQIRHGRHGMQCMHVDFS